MALYSGIYKSPVGPLYVYADDNNVRFIHFNASEGKAHRDEEGLAAIPKDTPLTKKVFKQFDEYFAGRRTSFDLPLDARGTPFQMKAWKALQSIPFGKTATYQDMAIKVKNPKAVRAIGGANNRNPICIVIPCHRVIGKSGDLVGFGGGLPKKVTLLKHEGSL